MPTNTALQSFDASGEGINGASRHESLWATFMSTSMGSGYQSHLDSGAGATEDWANNADLDAYGVRTDGTLADPNTNAYGVGNDGCMPGA